MGSFFDGSPVHAECTAISSESDYKIQIGTQLKHYLTKTIITKMPSTMLHQLHLLDATGASVDTALMSQIPAASSSSSSSLDLKTSFGSMPPPPCCRGTEVGERPGPPGAMLVEDDAAMEWDLIWHWAACTAVGVGGVFAGFVGDRGWKIYKSQNEKKKRGGERGGGGIDNAPKGQAPSERALFG